MNESGSVKMKKSVLVGAALAGLLGLLMMSAGCSTMGGCPSGSCAGGMKSSCDKEMKE